ncbi:MAG: hypothetical protein AB8V06_06940 [Francisella endosymbiont of Hyalomma asiaticum]
MSHYAILIYNDENPKRIYFSIKAKNDPIPLSKTIFAGTFTSALLMNDTLNDVAKYLYANNFYISREQLSKDVKFYVASGLNHVYLSSDNKKVKVLQWYELWSVDACGQNYSFLITLQEIVLEGLTGVLLKLILLSLQNLNIFKTHQK